jgi:hypothetical protein
MFVSNHDGTDQGGQAVGTFLLSCASDSWSRGGEWQTDLQKRELKRVLHAIHLESSQSAGSRRPDTCIATQRNVERGHTSWFARRCLAGSQQARMSESFVHLNNRHRLSTVYDSPFANIITR